MSKRTAREMDFAAYPSRHVVFRVAYHGQEMDGLARQVHTTNTVEQFFLDALVRVRLIPPLTTRPMVEGTTTTAKDAGGSAPSAIVSPTKFSRCGRTDKGVSALGNAFSLVVRGAKEGQEPLPYARMLNRALPSTIRVVAWAFVSDNFDARFSCLSRTYRYFFSTARRNLTAMMSAAKLLEGEHDFRNFCKMDVVNVSNFVRTVYEVQFYDAATGQRLAPLTTTTTTTAETAPAAVFVQIRGNAFLYHQIRCIMAVLFLVGDGCEEPGVVSQLLDTAAHPGKPTYTMASDQYLVLWDCAFAADEVRWIVDDGAAEAVLEELLDRCTALHTTAAMAGAMHAALAERFGPSCATKEEAGARRTNAVNKYVPLLRRPRENTFSEKVAGLSANKTHRRERNQAYAGSTARDAATAGRSGGGGGGDNDGGNK